MYITVTFPVADLRKIIPTAAKPLVQPYWPLPSTQQFTNYFGKIKSRKEFFGWIPEPFSCDCRKAIRIPKNFSFSFYHKPSKSAKSVFFDVMSRRFYYDGDVMAKFDLTFKLQKHFLHLEESLPIKELQREISKFEVSVVNPQKNTTEKKFKTCKLSQLEKLIPELLVLSTTKANEAISKPFWIYSCKPIIIVNSTRNNPPKTKKSQRLRLSKIVRNNKTSKVFSVYQETSGGWDCASWTLFGGKNTSILRRNFRLSLGRLHSESATFVQTLRVISNPKIVIQSASDESNILQKYLLKSAKDILGITLYDTKKYGFENNEVPLYCQLFPEAYLVHSGMKLNEKNLVTDTLKTAIAIRPNVLAKVNQVLSMRVEQEKQNIYNFYGPVDKVANEMIVY